MGTSGPLMQSLGSALLYYESWGQCWERAALIKARAVAGEMELGATFLKEIEPFIYRRYLDYTTIDEKPKRTTAQELKRIRNIRENPNVSVVIDRYDEDWRKLAYVLVFGTARIVLSGLKHRNGLRLLRR